MPLDEYDKTLLRLLQQNSRLPQQYLAEQVCLSVSATSRRISALEKAGYIRGYVALADAAALGRPITIITEVSLADERLDLINEAKQRFAACPQVQQVYYVTGEFDFVLVFQVRDMGEYDALTHSLFFENGNVRHFRTLVSMSNVKQALAVAVD